MLSWVNWSMSRKIRGFSEVGFLQDIGKRRQRKVSNSAKIPLFFIILKTSNHNKILNIFKPWLVGRSLTVQIFRDH